MRLAHLALLAAGRATADPHAQPLKFFNDYNQRRILEALDKLAPSDLNYRPTAEVRSLRELFGHIADTQFRVCAEDASRPNPHPASVEHGGPSKADLTATLNQAFTFCEDAYAADAGKTARALVVNTYHSGQHYGNIVTYLRLKGILPPGAEMAAKPKPRAPDEGKMETYYMGFLIKGPNWSPNPVPGAEKLQEAHLAHIRKMAETGSLLVAGPFLDSTQVRGILIFKASSAAEVTALAEQDPAVQAGRLVVEIHPWMVQKGVLPE